MERIRRHLTFANVTAVLALVVALGGTGAYASGLITSKQIKNGTIKNVDIHNGTIQAGKLDSSALTSAYSVSAYAAGDLTIVADGNHAGVATLSIPQAGSYVFTVTAEIINGDTTYGMYGVCQLVTPNVTSTGAAFLQPNSTDDAYHETIAIQAADTYTAPGTATLNCHNVTNGSALESIRDVVVTAVRVGELTVG